VFAIINATAWARGVSILLGIVLAASLTACALGQHKSEAESQADRATAERAESALAADQELFSRHITVRADNGVVRLTGFVWDPPDLVEAERIVQAVPGVTRVVNSLELQRNGMDNSPVSR
jgi:osmotically-inducible protein OsmY